MAGIDRCEDEVGAAGGLSKAEARALLSLVDERAERLQKEQGLAPDEAVRQAADQLAKAEAAAAAHERQNALLNLTLRIGRLNRIGERAAETGKRGVKNLAGAVGNEVTARNTPSRGNRLSAERVYNTGRETYQAGVAAALDKAGLLKTFRNGAIEREWARELYELSMQAAGQESRVGVTGNPAALEIAKVVHGFQQLSKQRLNRLGAWIGDYAGYITRTAHDMDKIRRAGLDDWRAFVEPRLSAETFEGVEDRAEFFRSTWSALATGKHFADKDQLGLKDAAFSGPGNMADRLSAGRKLHWKTADAWLDYQEKFGRGSLVEQTLGAFDRSARQESLMARWGTNPEAEFAADFQRLTEKYRDSDPDAVVALEQARKGIQTEFDYLTGEANRPARQQWAEAMAGVRAVQSMAKLGGVAFTHLSSFVTKAAELRYHGVGWLEAYRNSVESLLVGRGKGETKELSDLLLAGFEGMHGSMVSKFHGDDMPAGRMSKLANGFFQMSGLTYMLDAQKSGAARIMARVLGRNVENEFDKLPAELQRSLRSYDISPAEWDVLRSAPDHFSVDGRVHLTPHAAVNADAAALMAGHRGAAYTAEMVEAARDALGQKLHALISDVADRGIVTAGIPEKALFFRGAAPGTAGGEALRFLAQFKMWGAAAIRQGIGREVYGGQDTAGKISGIVQMALGTATMGYMVMLLKDTFKGITPRNPADPKTILAAMIQGGGFGIMGDYLFGQMSRFGQSAVESMAGPTAGTISDLIRAFDMARGAALGDRAANVKDIGPELLKVAQSNTPFLNLFYVRRALDYVLFHSLQEAMNPGYLRRAEQRLQATTGQTYVLPPSNHLHTFGH